MGVVFTHESAYAREMRKWEAYPTQFGGGERQYQYREFPKTLYKLTHVSGKGLVIDDRVTVSDPDGERRENAKGFYVLTDAQARAERQQTEFGKLAAEREYEIAHGRISEKAAAEVRAAEAEHGATHLPVVPETPIKKRGRPVKVVA